MFTPSIAVVTSIAPSHLEGLGSMNAVIKEKSTVVAALPKNGHAVLCYDDEAVRRMARLNQGRTIFYGFSQNADVWMDPPIWSMEGLSTTLYHEHGQSDLCFPYLLNKYHLYAVMAAWCVGVIADVPRRRMERLVQRFSPGIGRGRIVPGPGGSILLDETWNANPVSMLAAFETLSAVAEGRRRVMVLGDMLELGADSERLHLEIGRRAAAHGDVMIGIGEAARSYVEEFQQQCPSRPAYYRRTIEEGLEILDRELQPGDIVLLKASHGVHFDKLLVAIQKLSRF
jgi:UDP-N-acetylmuramoyl-tripeptide--D-alanyl-D-alanine ligase